MSEMEEVETIVEPVPKRKLEGVVVAVPPLFTAKVPVVSDKAIPKVEVLTQVGTPVVKEVWKIVPPVEEAIVPKDAAELA